MKYKKEDRERKKREREKEKESVSVFVYTSCVATHAYKQMLKYTLRLKCTYFDLVVVVALKKKSLKGQVSRTKENNHTCSCTDAHLHGKDSLVLCHIQAHWTCIPVREKERERVRKRLEFHSCNNQCTLKGRITQSIILYYNSLQSPFFTIVSEIAIGKRFDQDSRVRQTDMYSRK